MFRIRRPVFNEPIPNRVSLDITRVYTNTHVVHFFVKFERKNGVFKKTLVNEKTIDRRGL